MRELKIVREPGFIYDLIYVFVLRFNKEHCLSKDINYQKANEDTEFFTKIYNEYKDIPSELLPFFYMKDEGACLITEKYFSTHLDEFEIGYNFTMLYKELTDIDKLKSNVIRYYFPDFPTRELDKGTSIITLINSSIKCSQYNDSLKSALYSFFIDPDSIVKILLDELLTVQLSVRQKYESFGNKLLNFQSDFDFLFDVLKNVKKYSFDNKGLGRILIYPCLIRKNSVKLFCESKNHLFIGYDYRCQLEYLMSQEFIPDLDSFGNAIAEKNRVEILDLMLNFEEVTSKDLEQILNLTARNKGRTVYYSINKEYFTSVLKFLQRYI